MISHNAQEETHSGGDKEARKYGGCCSRGRLSVADRACLQTEEKLSETRGYHCMVHTLNKVKTCPRTTSLSKASIKVIWI